MNDERKITRKKGDSVEKGEECVYKWLWTKDQTINLL